MTKKITKLMLNGEEYEIREYQESGWHYQPNANTLLYLPLNGNATDYSNNHNDGTWTGTEEYKTVGSKQYAFMGENSAINLTSEIMSGNPSAFTHTVWVKTNTDGYAALFIFGQNTRTSRSNVIINYKRSPNYVSINDTYQVDIDLCSTTAAPRYQNQRVCVTYIYDSGNHQLYMNGQLVGTASRILNIVSGYQKQIGRTNSSPYCDFGLSECIFESGVRTSQEVEDYFDQTKSLYGIS